MALLDAGEGVFEVKGLGRVASASVLIFLVFSLLVGVDAALFLLVRGGFGGVTASSFFSATSLI